MVKSSPQGALKRRETAVHKDRTVGHADSIDGAFTRLETRIEELCCAASELDNNREHETKVDIRRKSEWDGTNPKGGDLCVATAKPVERLVEVGSDSDVQILHASCVKGRKTHRTT